MVSASTSKPCFSSHLDLAIGYYVVRLRREVKKVWLRHQHGKDYGASRMQSPSTIDGREVSLNIFRFTFLEAFDRYYCVCGVRWKAVQVYECVAYLIPEWPVVDQKPALVFRRRRWQMGSFGSRR